LSAIPASLCQLKQLQVFTASHNRLSRLPDELNQLTCLMELVRLLYFAQFSLLATTCLTWMCLYCCSNVYHSDNHQYCAADFIVNVKSSFNVSHTFERKGVYSNWFGEMRANFCTLSFITLK
jgi:Leucine-rich repeat (LRR) protein